MTDVLPSDVQIADKMPGASGAEMKACCTEAGMFALRERRVHVTQEDFEMATAKVRPWSSTYRTLMLITWPLGFCYAARGQAFIPAWFVLKKVECTHLSECSGAGYEEGLAEQHEHLEALEVTFHK